MTIDKNRSNNAGTNRGAYDQIAHLYDEDMGTSAPAGSVEFYVDRARQSGGPVLEFGCGTGRIAIPIAKAGISVCGVDPSAPMLDALVRKTAAELRPDEAGLLTWQQADMQSYSSESRFGLILCPYSVFTYLVERRDQAVALQNIRRHLRSNGQLIMDIFVQGYETLLLPDDHIFRDYRRVREDGSVLEREKIIEKDLDSPINTLRRTYRMLNPEGSIIESFTTTERIRFFFRSEVRQLLARHGMEVVEEYGGFQGEALDYAAKTMVFVARAATRQRLPDLASQQP